MPLPDTSADTDFDRQMKTLTIEAQGQADERASQKAGPSLMQLLRPLVQGLEALTRATAENKQGLNRLEEVASAQKDLPGLMTDVRESLDRRSSINQQLFDALHHELKGYRDGFLLEVLQKPLVRDLVCLFDDMTTIHKQALDFANKQEARTDDPAGHARNTELLGHLAQNVDHAIDFLLEIMSRMEVTRVENCDGKLDKKRQRAIAVELADSPEEDGEIVRSVKPGFAWRDRVVRPEEVIVKKWKEGFLVALPESQ